jgi:hypothetical protein
VTLLLVLLLAQGPPKQELQVSGHAGFGGVVDRGEWTPLTIDLDHRGAEDLDLVLSVVWGQSSGVQDSDKPTLASLYGKTGLVHRLNTSIAARSRKRLSIAVRAPELDRLNAWVFAESAKTGRTVAAGELLARSVPAKQRLVVTVGRDTPEGLGGFVAQTAPEHLPEDWRAYAGVDTLVWLDAKASELRSQAQADALRAWVEFGGRLVVARATVTLRGARPLASLSALAGPLGRAPEGRALALESSLERGAARLSQDGVPLVVEATLGRGSTIFVALDPAKEPLAGWAGAPRFWSWVAPVLPRAEATPNRENGPSVIGALPLCQQASQIPDVAPPALSGLFSLIVVYLIVVGPFDYFVLRKLKRLELTWITFPSYVALFTLLILFAGGAFIERAAYQREMIVVDRAADAPQERRRALSAVLAPRNQRYDLTEAEPVSSNFLMSQLGGLETGAAAVARTPGLVLKDWNVSRGATALVASDRAVPAKGSLSWAVKPGVLDVRNDTGASVRGAVLLTKDGAWDVDPIPPGAAAVRLGRRYGTVEAFLAHENAAVPPPVPDGDPSNAPWRRGVPIQASPRTITEPELDAQTRRVLLALSFGGSETATAGFARSLDARSWLAQGGSVLLVWEKPSKPEVAFTPPSNRLSAVTMVRYFQGPAK